MLRDAVVRIIADADKPGRAHARQVAVSLEGVASAVEITEAAVGKDAADHLAAGKSLADLVITKDAAVVAEPELAPDLYDFIAGEDPPIEWVIPDLLERGDRLIWTGEEGRGKSMALRQIAVAAAAGIQPFTDTIFRPQRVLIIDCENPERKSRRHFRALAEIARFKQRPVPVGGLRIILRPESINLGSEDEALWLLERVTAHKPDLLVIGPLYKLHALDINEEQARPLDRGRDRRSPGQGVTAPSSSRRTPRTATATRAPCARSARACSCAGRSSATASAWPSPRTRTRSRRASSSMSWHGAVRVTSATGHVSSPGAFRKSTGRG